MRFAAMVAASCTTWKARAPKKKGLEYDLALFHGALGREELIAPSAVTRRRSSTPSPPPSERADG